jgi:signal transduction histidine kinase
VQAVLAGLDGHESVEECRIALKNGNALDLEVTATPLSLDGHQLAFCVLKDISDEKRRRTLEHVFFHDILNSAGALRGMADLLRRAPLPDKDEIAGDVWVISDRLIDEIKSQKVLAAAENNELITECSPLQTRRFLEELVRFYQGHEVARGRRLALDDHARDVTLVSDRALLWRVLGNMLKNALEATPPGGTVTLGCRAGVRQIELWVNNPGEIPEEARLQIFQRSFSTKGAGRGLGTYSIKLFGERYLGGRVSFTTSQEKGTTFRIRLPSDDQALLL